VINIRHSFLPAFAGGSSYYQAHQRGVKLIGATAHYATAILDNGPIIQQDVARVPHRQTVRDLVVRGRMLERHVFAQAVRWYLETRVLFMDEKRWSLTSLFSAFVLSVMRLTRPSFL